jgi:acetyl/propionyl-CoA carboxylase alpha subunit
VARGEQLSFVQEDIRWSGHAMQCRINAESATDATRSGAGRIGHYLPPGGPGVRVCSGVYGGQKIEPQFDSLLAKLMVLGATRAEAIIRMRRALSEYVIEGVETNLLLHRRILADQNFVQGNLSTHYLTQLAPQSVADVSMTLQLPVQRGTTLSKREIAVLAASLYDSFKKTFRASGQSNWRQQARREQLKK